MFKGDLDYLYHEEQVKDFLRESEQLRLAGVLKEKRTGVGYSRMVLLGVVVMLALGLALVMFRP